MYYMNQDSEYKQRVWEFMKFLTGPEGAKIVAEANVWTPAYLPGKKWAGSKRSYDRLP